MAENNFSLQKTLTMLLDEKKYHSLRDILSTMNPADIAAIFDDLDQACLPLLFRLLPKELAAETFVEMEPEAQELLIRGFSDSELTAAHELPASHVRMSVSWQHFARIIGQLSSLRLQFPRTKLCAMCQ